MRIKSREISYFKFTGLIKDKTVFDLTNVEYPVDFYNGSSEHLLIVGIYPDGLDFLEKEMADLSYGFDEGKLVSKIEKYIEHAREAIPIDGVFILVEKDACELIMNLTTGELIEATTNSYPPENVSQNCKVLLFAFNPDYTYYPVLLRNTGYGASALYMRGLSSKLFKPTWANPTIPGENLAASLYCFPLKLETPTGSYLDHGIRGERTKMQYQESNLVGIESFKSKMSKAGLLDKEFITGEDTKFIDGEIGFQKIRELGRVPYFNRYHKINPDSDLGFTITSAGTRQGRIDIYTDIRFNPVALTDLEISVSRSLGISRELLQIHPPLG